MGQVARTGEIVPPFIYALYTAGAETAEIHDAVTVEDGDVVLNKPRYGAFTGTDLEMTLRTKGIDTVIISGIATNICCETTAREAAQLDFVCSSSALARPQGDERGACRHVAARDLRESRNGVRADCHRGRGDRQDPSRVGYTRRAGRRGACHVTACPAGTIRGAIDGTCPRSSPATCGTRSASPRTQRRSRPDRGMQPPR